MFYSVVNRLVRYGLGKWKLPVETQEYLGRTGPSLQAEGVTPCE